MMMMMMQNELWCDWKMGEFLGQAAWLLLLQCTQHYYYYYYYDCN